MMFVLVCHKLERMIEEVAMLVCTNRSQSVDDLAVAVGVSHGTYYKILTDHLNMSRVTQHGVATRPITRPT